MFKDLEKAKEFARENEGAIIIQEKCRSNEYEIVEAEEADYLVGFLKTHELIELEQEVG